DGSSFKVDPPSDKKAQDLHPVLHASLLSFPNWQQLLDASVGTAPAVNVEWPVQKFVSHSGSGTGLLFEVLWQSGDVSWEPLGNGKHLDALASYLEALGVDSITSLP
ncbi:hypothetical protein SISNIDRAFT_386676, partial [Sistotremastrum niveocremeum HHB9708]